MRSVQLCVFVLVGGLAPRRLSALSRTRASPAAARRRVSTLRDSPMRFTVEFRHTKELIVQKSRFIATVAPCASFEQASELFHMWRDPKASHNCWAYRSRDGYERYSDDGEPSGTAGKPIASAIECVGVVDAAVLVTRFFGGIKLGTGGLVRAYGQAARDVLRDSVCAPLVQLATVKCVFEAGYTGQVYRVAGSSASVCKIDEKFVGNQIEILFQLPTQEMQGFVSRIREMTKGSAQITEVSQS